MTGPEFDRYASSYRELHARSVRLSGEAPEYFAEYKIAHARRITGGRLPLPRVLDFGCGIGNATRHIERRFPDCDVVGTDVSAASLDLAQPGAGPRTSFVLMRDGELPFEDGSFGLALVSCVLHHIPPERHPALLRELHRVLAKDAWLAVYEHNPLNPLTVRAVRSCEFDENAILIPAPRMMRAVRDAGFLGAALRFIVFFPRMLGFLRWMEPGLAWLPAGAQYCVAARR